MKIPESWTFNNNEVASEFDSHVREQLPWYDMVSNGVCLIAKHYLPENGVVLDVGASTGNIGRRMSPMLKARNASLFAVESSEEMAAQYNGGGTLIVEDVDNVDLPLFDVAVLFLTVMFIPVSRRRQVMNKIKSKMREGGCIIIVDKCQPVSGTMSTTMRNLTLQAKMNNNVPAEEVMAKELSLVGVQRPINTFDIVGYGATEWFRYGDFAGWVIE